MGLFRKAKVDIYEAGRDCTFLTDEQLRRLDDGERTRLNGIRLEWRDRRNKVCEELEAEAGLKEPRRSLFPPDKTVRDAYFSVQDVTLRKKLIAAYLDLYVYEGKRMLADLRGADFNKKLAEERAASPPFFWAAIAALVAVLVGNLIYGIAGAIFGAVLGVFWGFYIIWSDQFNARQWLERESGDLEEAQHDYSKFENREFFIFSESEKAGGERKEPQERRPF